MQSLEKRILADLDKHRATSGSGSRLGDGDIKPKTIQVGEVQFGFECKDRPSQNHHGMSTSAWKKAKRQISAAGFEPVFITRNSSGEIVAHLLWNDFLVLLEAMS